MKTNRSTGSSKQRFLLKPKHLLAALFAIAVVAVGGVVLGIMHTSTQTQAEEESASASDNAASRVEVWAPQGASVPAGVSTEMVDSISDSNQEAVAQASESDSVNRENTETVEAKVENGVTEKPVIRHTPRRNATRERQRAESVVEKTEQEQGAATVTGKQAVEAQRGGNIDSGIGSAKPTRSEPSSSQNKNTATAAETPPAPPAQQDRPIVKTPQASPPQPVGSNESRPITDNLF
ncbi:hypothetical protein [Neisseria montereyensis]|uniref:Uncharacterized protein n=1 Tax=Neisseria montereyensis TaxID=2973938 RepID=A0ABT2FAA9_9NEIS|nr:hypothetical protein [Neisseria montereyensis]MCS4533151.1 hypothetical protein [Neisseria montereyensis]